MSSPKRINKTVAFSSEEDRMLLAAIEAALEANRFGSFSELSKGALQYFFEQRVPGGLSLGKTASTGGGALASDSDAEEADDFSDDADGDEATDGGDELDELRTRIVRVEQGLSERLEALDGRVEQRLLEQSEALESKFNRGLEALYARMRAGAEQPLAAPDEAPSPSPGQQPGAPVSESSESPSEGEAPEAPSQGGERPISTEDPRFSRLRPLLRRGF